MQVRLIGYCVEGSLFLVYEYIENGNLSQHLQGSSEISYVEIIANGIDSEQHLQISVVYVQAGSHFLGLLECKLPLTQPEVLNISMSILSLFMFTVTLNQLIY